MLEAIKPIDIILVTYNRSHFLKKAIDLIYERTRYPHHLIVVDNNSTDDTEKVLKNARIVGKIHKYIKLPENKGLANGYSEGFKEVESDYFITTQDDCFPPDLTPCWLERMLYLLKNNPDYVALSMRIQRIRHRNVDEFKDIIESPTSLASVFRIQKKEDIEIIGGFGSRPHWESTAFKDRVKPLKKKLGVVTGLYSDHAGFMEENKGFAKDFTNYHTYAKEKVKQGEYQPYPVIDEKTNIPLKILTDRDAGEQFKREEYWNYWGVDKKKHKHLTPEKEFIKKYAAKGKGLDIGCGHSKCHPNAIGVDVYPFDAADMVIDATNLWMFKDGELDFIVSSHTLEHLPDTKKVLTEWKRVLKPGGIMVIVVPDGEANPIHLRSSCHKVNLGPMSLKVLFKHCLKMKMLGVGNVPGKKEGRKKDAYVIARKRK